MENFYKRINEVLDEQGISNSALARAIGVSHTSVAKIRKGQNMPGADVVTKFALHTGISLDWLLTGCGEKHRLPGEALPERAKGKNNELIEQLKSLIKG